MPEFSCPYLPIDCQRLRLRDFRRDDLEIFANYRADADIARYQGWDNFSMEDALEFFETLESLRFGVSGTWYQIAIARLDTDKLAGDCVIHFTGDESTVEIGFTLAPQVHGRGFAFEAISALIDLIFNMPGKQRIIAVTHAYNGAAHRLLDRLGFDSRNFDSAGSEPELLHSLDRERRGDL